MTLQSDRVRRYDQYNVDEARARLTEVHAELTALRDRFESQGIDLENAEVELRVLRRQLKAANRTIFKMQTPESGRELADEVFAYWKEKCRGGTARVVFGPKRKLAVHARIREGAELPEFKQAIDGAVKGAYVGENGVRHDDLEIICRDEVMFDKFKARALSVTVSRGAEVPGQVSVDDARHRILDALWADYSDRMVEDAQMGWWSAPCPSRSCAGGSHNTLRVRTDDVSPLVSCERCEINTMQVLGALDEAS